MLLLGKRTPSLTISLFTIRLNYLTTAYQYKKNLYLNGKYKLSSIKMPFLAAAAKMTSVLYVFLLS